MDAQSTLKPTKMILHLDVLPASLAVVKLDPDSPIPEWASGDLLSITRTPEECSIVCNDRDVPDDVTSTNGWRCVKVRGPLGFDVIGILDSIAQPLRTARISIFVVSTYNTDYILIPGDQFDEARRVLRAAGHVVE